MSAPTLATDLTAALELLRDYGWTGAALAIDHDDLELDEEALGYPDAPIARVSAVGALWLAVEAGRSLPRHERFMSALDALVTALPAGELVSAENSDEALATWEQDVDREQSDVEALFARAIAAQAAVVSARREPERRAVAS